MNYSARWLRHTEKSEPMLKVRPHAQRYLVWQVRTYGILHFRLQPAHTGVAMEVIGEELPGWLSQGGFVPLTHE